MNSTTSPIGLTWGTYDENFDPIGGASILSPDHFSFNVDGDLKTAVSNLPIVQNSHTGNNEVRVLLEGHICTENTTLTPLGSNEVFTGEWQDTVNYASIVIGVNSDQNSATDGLEIQWSANGTDVHDTDNFSILANKGKVFSFGPARRYFRIEYTNGTIAQTSFNLESSIKATQPKPSSHRLLDNIVGDDDAELVKSVITGEDENGVFENVRIVQGQTGYNMKVSLDQIEPSTNSVKVIDYSHAELHRGDHYFYTDHVELDSAAIQNYLITTSNTAEWGHMHIMASGSAITTVEVFEATDKTGTTAQTVFNNNRNSANTATITVHKGISGGTTDGTRLIYTKSGSSTNQSRSGGEVRNDEELLLKQNTKYIVRITSGTNDNLCNLALYWYEHTNLI
jgi:hypothetical protein